MCFVWAFLIIYTRFMTGQGFHKVVLLQVHNSFDFVFSKCFVYFSESSLFKYSRCFHHSTWQKLIAETLITQNKMHFCMNDCTELAPLKEFIQKCKCTLLQAIQDVEEFVSSSEQIWRNTAFLHLLTDGSSAVNGCRQNECSNSWLKHLINRAVLNCFLCEWCLNWACFLWLYLSRFREDHVFTRESNIMGIENSHLSNGLKLRTS